MDTLSSGAERVGACVWEGEYCGGGNNPKFCIYSEVKDNRIVSVQIVIDQYEYDF